MQILLPSYSNNSMPDTLLSAPIAPFPPEMEIGESFQARVIFCSAETAHLKTDAGIIIRAHLENGIQLPEGEMIILTLSEKVGGSIKLHVSEIAADFSQNTSLAANQLSEFPVALAGLEEQLLASPLSSQQRLEVFIRALADYPALSTEDTRVLQIADQLMGKAATPSSENLAKSVTKIATPLITGQMLQQLRSLLSTTSTNTQQIAEKISLPESLLAPLFELFIPDTTVQSPKAALPQQSISQTLKEILTTQNEEEAKQNQNQPAQTVLSSLPTVTRRELLAFTQQLVAEIFSSAAPSPGTQELAAYIDRLFVTPGSSAKKDAFALQQAAQELEIRVNLLESAIKHIDLTQKEELLTGIRHILHQTAALQEERLFILGLPLQFAEQKQTAELYVYRREKGQPKVDPSQATVLLALNTEHLGRLEAFIQIQQKELNIKLKIGNTTAIPFIEEQSSTLSKLVNEAGYRLAFVSIQPLASPTGPHNALQALEEFRRNIGQQVNIII